MAKEQPKVHDIDGKQYVEVERQAKAGDLIYYPEDDRVATVVGENVEDIKDSSETYLSTANIFKHYVLKELVTATEGNPREILDLIGNLATRLTKLERSVRSLQTAYTVRENNVIAHLQERIERNERDMEELGERLLEKETPKESVVHFDRMFEGATFNLKAESDITAIAKELYSLQLKARGRR